MGYDWSIQHLILRDIKPISRSYSIALQNMYSEDNNRFFKREWIENCIWNTYYEEYKNPERYSN